MALTVKEESYCQGIAKYGRKAKVKAYTEAGYSTNFSENAIGVAAARIYNKSKISLRIDELMETVKEVAKEKFSISVEWRLGRLKAISDAGITKYKDANETERFENLAASNAAVKTMNEMLGTTDGDDDNKGDPLSITFSVSSPVKEVKVTRGE